jgi:hypothetical protein
LTANLCDFVVPESEDYLDRHNSSIKKTRERISSFYSGKDPSIKLNSGKVGKETDLIVSKKKKTNTANNVTANQNNSSRGSSIEGSKLESNCKSYRKSSSRDSNEADHDQEGIESLLN